MLIGLASTGIHSNGLTMARRVLLDQEGLRVNQYVPELGRLLGEELLAPTRIYVREVCAMLDAQLPSRRSCTSPVMGCSICVGFRRR